MIQKNILLVVIFFFFVSSHLVLAYNIDSLNTEVEVYNDGVAKVVNNFVLDSTKIKALLIPTYSPESLIVTDSDGEVKFAVMDNIIVIKPEKKTSKYEIKIQYLTSDLTSKNSDEWKVNYPFLPYEKLKIDGITESRLVFSLPITATITAFSDEGIIFTEHNRMKIGWKLSLEKNKNTEIEAMYKNTPQLAGTDYIKMGFYVLLIIFLGLLIFFCGKKSYCKIMRRITKGKKDIMKTLNKNENEVTTLLLERKNQLYQSAIQKETSISKATLSRVIKRLEDKGIIEIRPSGNTNLIILQDWFIKK